MLIYELLVSGALAQVLTIRQRVYRNSSSFAKCLQHKVSFAEVQQRSSEPHNDGTAHQDASKLMNQPLD